MSIFIVMAPQLNLDRYADHASSIPLEPLAAIVHKGAARRTVANPARPRRPCCFARHLDLIAVTDDPVQSTAVHETGHAIAAVHLGVTFQAVELRVDLIDGFWHCGGRLRGADLPETADNKRLWDQLVIIMSGYAAVSLLKPSEGFSLAEFTFPDGRDFDAATELQSLMRSPVTSREAAALAMDQAWLQAREVVASNWQRMAALADEIVRRCHPGGELSAAHIELTPEEVSRLIAGVT